MTKAIFLQTFSRVQLAREYVRVLVLTLSLITMVRLVMIVLLYKSLRLLMTWRSYRIGYSLFVRGICVKYTIMEHHHMTMSNVAFTTKPLRTQEIGSKRRIMDHINTIVVEKLLYLFLMLT